MAKRRMISSDVVSTDAFLGMSLRARELYVHLNLEADDDGFISSALKVTRMVGASKKHLCELVDKGYLIAFDGGLHLVTHWLLNNTFPPFTKRKRPSLRRKARFIGFSRKRNWPKKPPKKNKMASKWTPKRTLFRNQTAYRRMTLWTPR